MNTKFLFASLLFAGALTACSDENVVNEAVSNGETEPFGQVYDIALVDEGGNTISSLNGDFRVVYADVKAEGKWTLSTSNPNYVYLTTAMGEGNAKVPVFVSTCWAEDRSFSISAAPLNYKAVTRADGDGSVSTDPITQQRSYDLNTVKERLSSNLGAGYSVSIATSNNILMTTQLQLFNMRGIAALEDSANICLLSDDLTPQLEQKYMESNSYEKLRQKVTVGLKGTVSSGKLEDSNLTGNVNVGSDSTNSASYAVRRQLSKLFTRHIDYLSITALEEMNPNYRGIALAPGFRMKRDSLQARLLNHLSADNATDSLICYQLVDEFIREVGPNFIAKASMGCALDYYIKVDSSMLSKEVKVNAVLDLKYESQVKDTVKNVVTDSTKFSANASVDVLNKANKAASNSEIEIVINGGDVTQVDILCNGGQLTTADIQKWQQSISPAMSVMVEMEVVPISALFWNEKAALFIYNYLVAQGLTERYIDQALTNK